MNILFISSWFPSPPTNGAKIRIHNLLKQLSDGHNIRLVSLAKTISVDEAMAQIPYLRQYCSAVSVVSGKEFIPGSVSAYRGWLSPQPSSLRQTLSREMADIINYEVANNKFDVVVASEVNAPSQVSFHASKIKNLPIILDALEVALEKDAYKNQRNLLRRFRCGLTWYKLRGFTRSLLQSVNACTVPSIQEKQNIQEIMRQSFPVKIIPHSLDLTQYWHNFGRPNQNVLIFTGSFNYQANFDAVRYFLEKIYPRVKSVVPDVTLKIIGNTNNKPIESLPIDENVIFKGFLSDVRPEVANSWLSIVPLRVGSGTRLKIIESMALGTPVVSTSKGAEGLDVKNGRDILIADNESDFADCVVRLIAEPQLREKLSLSGRELVARKYDSKVLAKDLSTFMTRVVESYRSISNR